LRRRSTPAWPCGGESPFPLATRRAGAARMLYRRTVLRVNHAFAFVQGQGDFEGVLRAVDSVATELLVRHPRSGHSVVAHRVGGAHGAAEPFKPLGRWLVHARDVHDGLDACVLVVVDACGANGHADGVGVAHCYRAHASSYNSSASFPESPFHTQPQILASSKLRLSLCSRSASKYAHCLFLHTGHRVQPTSFNLPARSSMRSSASIGRISSIMPPVLHA